MLGRSRASRAPDEGIRRLVLVAVVVFMALASYRVTGQFWESLAVGVAPLAAFWVVAWIIEGFRARR